MLDKVQNACIKALSKVDKLEIRGMPRIMVYLFLFIVIFCLLLFLTAWNEWGEGAYLEPDTKNGFAYLEAVSHVVNDQVNKVGDK